MNASKAAWGSQVRDPDVVSFIDLGGSEELRAQSRQKNDSGSFGYDSGDSALLECFRNIISCLEKIWVKNIDFEQIATWVKSEPSLLSSDPYCNPS